MIVVPIKSRREICCFICGKSRGSHDACLELSMAAQLLAFQIRNQSYWKESMIRK